MSNWLNSFYVIISSDKLGVYLRTCFILLLGLILAALVRKGLNKILTKSIPAQQATIAQKISSYLIALLFLTWALNELGFSISVLLGAAGVLTVALGFASQTSVSNIISGLFLIFEKPFSIDDVIEVEDVTGVVLSIDLLSVKLRTFDNLYIRIPNETMLKTKVINKTKFPIRRLDMLIGVAYKENISKVREILFSVAEKNPLCLENPKPVFIFKGYGESSLNIQFSVWMKREKYLDLNNSIYEEIKNAFDDNKIEIPYPHRSLIIRQENSDENILKF